ncbi:hypothetical protein BCR43DRAFT_522325 [Syncephalastrum racemosum]|uniref:Uncharacterized protein n=1 Tax=Syncephalastrum racemosum TaxID=13706 RepID=A0A1X2HQ56_SYNRA|nr:hypothetical protein BCR43DRAFT_522325 [Syncephalastrum racemosum]
MSVPSYPPTALPPSPISTPRNSSSSQPPPALSASRFSVNSNLMNYSIPKSDDQTTETHTPHAPYSTATDPLKTPPPEKTDGRRTIQRGNSSTRVRQLEAQIESLTLQNVKLQRTNRLLKVDTDNLIKQTTQPLEQKIRELTLNNVQLQRTTRLLQQDVEQKVTEMEKFKQEQIAQMKNVGPEYEFLVQMVNVLHRQISGDPSCDETCCFTLQPIQQSSMVMTLPPSDQPDDQEMEAQHICRPIIHSSISQGSYAIELENKILRLEQVIEELDAEKEQFMKQMSYKDNDLETLKRELRIKDDIVSQLEGDFLSLEDQLARLQKELKDHHTAAAAASLSLPTPSARDLDPKRQSQMLMANKRRSLAVKDTDALERMLRGDLDDGRRDKRELPYKGPGEEQIEDNTDEEYDEKNTTMTTPPRSQSPGDHQEQGDADAVSMCSNGKNNDDDEQQQKRRCRRPVLSFLSGGVLPCAYPTATTSQLKHIVRESEVKDPFAPFTLMTILLALAAQFGITDDWTVPITLAVLVSGFLWSGAAKGVQFKLKLQ